jgi:OmpA-OmpF porin, OOP family
MHRWIRVLLRPSGTPSSPTVTRVLFAAMFGVLFMGATSCGSAPATQAKAAGVPDVDQDQIPDDIDECVTEKEDHAPPKPDDGCKLDPNDTDGDGVGTRDKCPAERESINGYEDEDGCPDELPTENVVTVTKDELKCCAKILFANGRSTVDPASAPVLEHVAKTLKDNPKIEFLEVAGHADKLGNAKTNLELTKQRAMAVVEALAKLGVEKARLRPEGYGSYCPLSEDDTPEARELNRRVEFKIVRQGGADTGAALGCAAAAQKGIGAIGSGQPKPAGGSI